MSRFAGIEGGFEGLARMALVLMLPEKPHLTAERKTINHPCIANVQYLIFSQGFDL
jgi:hypothetical protein